MTTPAPIDLTASPQVNSNQPLTFTEDVAVVDDFTVSDSCAYSPNPPITHGYCVDYIIQALSPVSPGTGQPEVSVAPFQIFRPAGAGRVLVMFTDLAFQLRRLAMGAASAGHAKVINLSIVAYPNDGFNRHGSTVTDASLRIARISWPTNNC